MFANRTRSEAATLELCNKAVYGLSYCDRFSLSRDFSWDGRLHRCRLYLPVPDQVLCGCPIACACGSIDSPVLRGSIRPDNALAPSVASTFAAMCTILLVTTVKN